MNIVWQFFSNEMRLQRNILLVKIGNPCCDPILFNHTELTENSLALSHCNLTQFQRPITSIDTWTLTGLFQNEATVFASLQFVSGKLRSLLNKTFLTARGVHCEWSRSRSQDLRLEVLSSSCLRRAPHQSIYHLFSAMLCDATRCEFYGLLVLEVAIE